MWPTILFAFEVEAWNGAENLEPGGRVAADFDLRASRSKRIECLIQQIAHDAGLRLIPGRANVPNREVVVDTHVALDEAGHLPVL